MRRMSTAMRSIPATMRSIKVGPPLAGEKRPGPDSLHCEVIPTPAPRRGEVLIRVAAAGVNRPDTLQRQGLYAAPKGHSEVLGLEVAGEVAACGEDVPASLVVGDRVCALANGGGYAEYCLVPASQVLPVPSGLTMLEAACLPETFFTVWQVFQQTNNVGERLFDKPSPSFMVHGGTSGIGITAIQIAKALGARQVFTTAGSEEKCNFCKDVLGASAAFNYKTLPSFREAVLNETSGKGLDMVLDMVVGKGYTQQNIDVLARGGRLAIIGFLGGAKVEANLTNILLKGLSISGSTLRSAPDAVKAVIAQELHTKIWPLLEAKSVKVFIDSTFQLENAAAAHERLDEGNHIGKVCLEVGPLSSL